MRLRIGLGIVMLAGLMPSALARGHAQASAIQSAQGAPAGTSSEAKGRMLLDEMVAALGGDAWLHRGEWTEEGKVASFYKGQPNDTEYGFESYIRAQPFGERVILIAHYGPIIGTDHRDVGEVWTPDGGFEITYKGKKAMKPEDVAEFQRRRAHSIDVALNDWLKQPGAVVTYDGSGMNGRRLVDTVSILTANNDNMTIRLDEATHLPVSRSYQYRDAVYHDLDTDEEQYDNYQPWQGVLTPMTVTRLHNGDMVSQQFLTKVKYDAALDPELFNPDKPMMKAGSKK